MKIPHKLFVTRPLFKDERGSTQLLQCPTYPFADNELTHGKAPTQIILSQTNPYTGRGLHFQKKNPLFQIISVIHGEIIECLVQRDLNENNIQSYSKKIKSTDENNTFMVPAGWAHGFYTMSNHATLLYMVWGKREIADEYGLNLKSKVFKFIDKPLRDKITLNKRDANYEHI